MERCKAHNDPACSTCHVTPLDPTISFVAFYPDWSAFAVFAEEIDALRYAVEHGMKVTEVKDGEVLFRHASGAFVRQVEL